MHPLQTDLRKYVDGRLEPDASKRIDSHLAACDLCREVVVDLRLCAQSIEQASRRPLPAGAAQLAARVYNSAVRGRIIDLARLESELQPGALLLAADGKEQPKPDIQNLTTLYSENPEIVLRVMRDARRGQDYLQLISDDERLAANALIRLPELGREYVTDREGKSDLNDLSGHSLADLKWQIKLPDAEFDLQPVIYDADRTEYQTETLLQTERDDKVRVTFEGKTEGKQIRLEILQLDGKTNFGPVSLVVAQADAKTVMRARPNEAVSFHVHDTSATIHIRVFA